MEILAECYEEDYDDEEELKHEEEKDFFKFDPVTGRCSRYCILNERNPDPRELDAMFNDWCYE
tara:strand:+ start:8763 stop:8951 length:189 start_codon:yes stop_codon:yes gene_type:complete